MDRETRRASLHINVIWHQAEHEAIVVHIINYCLDGIGIKISFHSFDDRSEKTVCPAFVIWATFFLKINTSSRIFWCVVHLNYEKVLDDGTFKFHFEKAYVNRFNSISAEGAKAESGHLRISM